MASHSALRRVARLKPAVVMFAAFTFVGISGMSVTPRSAFAQPLRKLTVLVEPTVPLDSIWMADAQGYFKDAGLDIDLKVFPSGTTALQSFKAGFGDFVNTGELPGVAYWHNTQKQFRIIAVAHRESVIYTATAKKEIKSAEDLRGKIIGTRVGSTGSWFIAEYLQKNGVPESSVTIKNLDTQVLPIALCRGDIDAFFIWQPAGDRALQICPDKVHTLSTAEGYIRGYGMLGARPQWLADPANAKATADFLRAIVKGRKFAVRNFPAVFAYMKKKFGYNKDLADYAKYSWSNTERYFGFDKTFYHDFCQLSSWMQKGNLLTEPINFNELVYKDGLAAVDPTFIALPSNKCPGP